jgi:hypothetical protein
MDTMTSAAVRMMYARNCHPMLGKPANAPSITDSETPAARASFNASTIPAYEASPVVPIVVHSAVAAAGAVSTMRCSIHAESENAAAVRNSPTPILRKGVTRNRCLSVMGYTKYAKNGIRTRIRNGLTACTCDSYHITPRNCRFMCSA